MYELCNVNEKYFIVMFFCNVFQSRRGYRRRHDYYLSNENSSDLFRRKMCLKCFLPLLLTFLNSFKSHLLKSTSFLSIRKIYITSFNGLTFALKSRRNKCMSSALELRKIWHKISWVKRDGSKINPDPNLNFEKWKEVAKSIILHGNYWKRIAFLWLNAIFLSLKSTQIHLLNSLRSLNKSIFVDFRP